MYGPSHLIENVASPVWSLFKLGVFKMAVSLSSYWKADAFQATSFVLFGLNLVLASVEVIGNLV